MKKPPPIISFVWHQSPKNYEDGLPVGEDLCIPIEGAILATAIVAVSPEDFVREDGDQHCTIHLYNGSVLQCVEPAETVIRRWVGALMRDVELRPGWNPT